MYINRPVINNPYKNQSVNIDNSQSSTKKTKIN